MLLIGCGAIGSNWAWGEGHHRHCHTEPVRTQRVEREKNTL